MEPLSINLNHLLWHNSNDLSLINNDFKSSKEIVFLKPLTFLISVPLFKIPPYTLGAKATNYVYSFSSTICPKCLPTKDSSNGFTITAESVSV